MYIYVVILLERNVRAWSLSSNLNTRPRSRPRTCPSFHLSLIIKQQLKRKKKHFYAKCLTACFLISKCHCFAKRFTGCFWRSFLLVKWLSIFPNIFEKILGLFDRFKFFKLYVVSQGDTFHFALVKFLHRGQ